MCAPPLPAVVARHGAGARTVAAPARLGQRPDAIRPLWSAKPRPPPSRRARTPSPSPCWHETRVVIATKTRTTTMRSCDRRCLNVPHPSHSSLRKRRRLPPLVWTMTRVDVDAAAALDVVKARKSEARLLALAHVGSSPIAKSLGQAMATVHPTEARWNSSSPSSSDHLAPLHVASSSPIPALTTLTLTSTATTSARNRNRSLRAAALSRLPSVGVELASELR